MTETARPESGQCAECGRTVESPRTIRGYHYCGGCWHAHTAAADASAHEAASLGWAAMILKAGLVLSLIAYGVGVL